MKRKPNYSFLLLIVITHLLIASTILCVKFTAGSGSSKTLPQMPDNNLQNYFLRDIKKLSADLNFTIEDELCISVIHELYSKLKYVAEPEDFENIVGKIALKIEIKLNETFTILKDIADVIDKYHGLDNLPLPSVIAPCNKEQDGRENGENIKNYDEVEQVLLRATGSYNKLKNHWKHLYFLSNFDVTNDSNASADNCNGQMDQSQLWSIFMDYHKYAPRNVMLLLDNGGSLTKQQLATVKNLAHQLITSLTATDRLVIATIADDHIHHTAPPTTLPPDQCPTPPPFTDNTPPLGGIGLGPQQSTQRNNNAQTPPYWTVTTPSAKRTLYQWVEALRGGGGGGVVTNHSMVFQWALDALSGGGEGGRDVMLVYVSRGLLSSIADARPVLEIIAQGVKRVVEEGRGNGRVVINTVAVLDETKPILFETQFLRDIAEQNYSQYNVESFSSPTKGISLTLNSSQNVGLTVARLLHHLQISTFDPSIGPRISLPQWDDISKDVSVSITIPWAASDIVYGLLGADLYFADLVEDVTYFSSNLDYSYAFLIDKTGLSVMHPSYQLPLTAYEQPRFADIRQLERTPLFEVARRRMLTEARGSQTLVTAENNTVEYVWEQVSTWYTVCVFVNTYKPPPKHPYKVHWYYDKVNQLLHYRLDLLPAEKMCLHLNQVSTLDAGTLFLSAACFKSAFAYTQSLDGYSSANVQKIMAYLTDNTRLISNPGLREHVRDEVAALSIVLDYLRAQHLGGVRSRYIVRRYVAGRSGAVLMYPGGVMAPRFEPSRRDWYRKAHELKGTTILTPPYLDAGGAGYIVTIAHATDHLVVAMDVTLGYVYKLVLDAMSFCGPGPGPGHGHGQATRATKCFLMDDRGYLIYHPNLLDPNGRGPLERQHIIHKESFVASDLLMNQQRFVQKRLCTRYADGTLQRYYQLNTSLGADVVVNGHGHGHGHATDHCARYQVAGLRGTNAFVAVLNVSCDLAATFCPCSVLDRRCLNCNRMEQRECECPCECPLVGCALPQQQQQQQWPLCPGAREPPFQLPTQRAAAAAPSVVPLRQCLPIACDRYTTYATCLGTLGCEWCQYDVDGERLRGVQPFCTPLRTCWGGVVGAQPPAAPPPRPAPATAMPADVAGGGGSGATLPAGASPDDDPANPHHGSAAAAAAPAHYSPVGPIVGAVIGMCLILVVLFFCQRSYAAALAAAAAAAASGTDAFYTAQARTNQPQPADDGGGGGGHMRMSDLNNATDDYHDVVDRDRLLRPDGGRLGAGRAGGGRKAQPVLSPYCVFGGYRRPADSSDHGYSTMTPHDDSEHLSFAPFQIDDADNAASASASVSDLCDTEAEGSSTWSAPPAARPPKLLLGLDVQATDAAAAQHQATLIDAQFTKLPPMIGGGGRNCIIAPVTVHRNMETAQI